VLEGVGLDRRIGREFLYPGVGYGGSCFPKDVKALIAIAKTHGYDFSILTAVEEVNKQVKTNFIEKITKHFDGELKGKTIAIFGLSFKPNTDDMREAPSIDIITKLQKNGARIVVFDPIAMENAKTVLPKGVVFAASAYEAAHGADAVAIVTEWNEFRQIDLVRLAKELKGRVLFDGRNIYDPQSVKDLGFTYYGVGRM
jgi:UDPglucose 6-dehydrogenase